MAEEFYQNATLRVASPDLVSITAGGALVENTGESASKV
jgi:hypothetical protein